MIGSHMRVSNNNIAEMISDLIINNGNVVQFFGKSPMNFKATMSKFTGIDKAKKLVKKHNIIICTHAQYVFNFTLPKFGNGWKLKKTVESIIKDLILNDLIGGIGTVIHLGSNTKNIDNWENIVSDNIFIIVNEMERKGIKSKFIIENQPKTGKKIFCKVEDILSLWKVLESKIGKKRVKKYIGLCMDTCHSYITNKKIDTIIPSLEKVHKEIGIDLIHFNDSKSKTADRHEDLFSGFIGNSCKHIIFFVDKNNITMVI